MINEDLYELASQAIKRLFQDKSVDEDQTISNLSALMDECQDYIFALEEQQGEEGYGEHHEQS